MKFTDIENIDKVCDSKKCLNICDVKFVKVLVRFHHDHCWSIKNKKKVLSRHRVRDFGKGGFQEIICSFLPKFCTKSTKFATKRGQFKGFPPGSVAWMFLLTIQKPIEYIFLLWNGWNLLEIVHRLPVFEVNIQCINMA